MCLDYWNLGDFLPRCSSRVSWEGDRASSHRVYFQQQEEKDISAYYLDVFCKLKSAVNAPERGVVAVSFCSAVLHSFFFQILA